MSVYQGNVLVGEYRATQPLYKGRAVYLVKGKREFTDYSQKANNVFLGIALEDSNVIPDVNMQGEIRSRVSVILSGQVLVEAGEALAIGDLVKVGANGKIVKEAGGEVLADTIGICLEDIAANKYGMIHLVSKAYKPEA